MKNYDSELHVRGRSQFIDDLTLPEGTLHAALICSPAAHGKINSINFQNAISSKCVAAVFTAEDIPGENQVGGIVQDEPLLASDHVHYIGQPVGLVVAEDQLTARQAARNVVIDIEELPAVFDPREAYKKNEFIVPPMIFTLGDTEAAWKDCDTIIEGTVESGGQEHFYLETQGAVSIPEEGGKIKVISSTQSPTAVQRVCAGILNFPMHKIEVDTLRLGGGFGGKEDQATPYAAMTALAAYLLKVPVKLVLPRQEDMRITGKRHPYSSDFKIGLDKNLKIIAYEAEYFQNAGAAADLSPAILQRTMTHATNSYYIPNVKAAGYSCRTNLPPFTAFRGFGGPQGMFVIEAAIHKAAMQLGVQPYEIQKVNLLKEGDELPYGQKTEKCNSGRCWTALEDKSDIRKLKDRIDKFNNENVFRKKGFAVMPICFGISFTNKFLNQANALVHIYTDGSVGVSTGAVEMGQGVNAKIRQVVSEVLSVNLKRVKIETTNTTRAANTSATAASTGSDLNGKAAEIACKNLLKRLLESAAEELNVSDTKAIAIVNELVLVNNKKTELSWKELIRKTYFKRISLSAQAHYATPGIYFDADKNKGKPFAYHSYGTAVVEATVDCLRGVSNINSVKAVHDFGKSLNKLIDRGQAEGAMAQGIGWMTLEEVIYDDKGKLITDALSTYKVPDIHFAPDDVEIEFLEDSENPLGLLGSKAIGEPPLMYGIGAYFAILNALISFRPQTDIRYKAPMTNERILLTLYPDEGKVEKYDESV